MQVDPIKATLKAPGTKRLKLKHDELLSTFAFNFNVRRYSKGVTHLSLTVKFYDGLYVHYDIVEGGKQQDARSHTANLKLGSPLTVDGIDYEDLDEVYARHVEPMVGHLKDLLKHRKFRKGTKTEVDQRLKAEMARHPGTRPYALGISHEHAGMFCLGAILSRTGSVHHEYVSVRPDGFRFRRMEFPSVDRMLAYFKVNPNPPSNGGGGDGGGGVAGQRREAPRAQAPPAVPLAQAAQAAQQQQQFPNLAAAAGWSARPTGNYGGVVAAAAAGAAGYASMPPGGYGGGGGGGGAATFNVPPPPQRGGGGYGGAMGAAPPPGGGFPPAAGMGAGNQGYAQFQPAPQYQHPGPLGPVPPPPLGYQQQPQRQM